MPRVMPLAGSVSDRLRNGRIPADPLASRPPADDFLPIHTPHNGARFGRRWSETPPDVLYQRN